MAKLVELLCTGKNDARRQFIPRRHGWQTCESFGGRVKTGQPSALLSATDDWHNRLIAGDKAVVLPALLHEFANQVDLIYIDPPFMTGRNFPRYSYNCTTDLHAYLP